MKNFRFSSKMHLFIIISSVIVAIGLMVGLICQFCANGFFNWGGDYSSYSSVQVKYYEILEGSSTDEVKDLCKDTFSDYGLNNYVLVEYDTTYPNTIEYRFYDADYTTIQEVASELDTIIKAFDSETGTFTGATPSYYKGVLGGTDTLIWLSVALASAVVFQFLYYLIRYKLTMALSAFVANFHNLLVFLALLAITRVEVSMSIFALGLFTVLLTMVGCAMLFDKMRKNFRTDEYKAMTSFEQSDAAARDSFRMVTTISCALVVAFIIILLFVTIGALSVYSLFMACIAGILSTIACEYGTMLFVPAFYSRLKLKSDIHAQNKIKKVRSGKPAKVKKSDKSASAQTE